MFMTKVTTLSLLLVSMVLGACVPDTAVPVIIPPTRTMVMLETGTAVAQTPPTATIAFTPTPTPAQTHPLTNTPQSTSTPRPTRTPTPTSTPKFVDLPAWAFDPAINVLLLETEDMRGRNNAVTLFNAQTGERFEIPIGEYVDPKWAQHEDGLYIRIGYFVSSDAQSEPVDEINAMTGEMRRFEIPKEFTPGVSNISSPDGRYLIHVVEADNIPTIATLINQETGEEIELTDPFNGEYADGISVEWSADGQIVGVERFRRVEDPTAHYGVRAVPALAVFSLDGTLLARYDDIDSRSLNWSSIIPYRLLYPAYGLNNEPPCILDVFTSQYDCIETVAHWRDEQEVEIGIFKWSPDSSKIGFIYWSWSKSGFCYVELSTDAITCPITRDGLQVDEYLEHFAMEDGVAYMYVTDYQWSPDGQFIALAIDPFSPLSDDRTLETVAVIDITGKTLRVIFDGSLEYYNQWRPSIPSPSEE